MKLLVCCCVSMMANPLSCRYLADIGQFWFVQLPHVFLVPLLILRPAKILLKTGARFPVVPVQLSEVHLAIFVQSTVNPSYKRYGTNIHVYSVHDRSQRLL